LMLSSAASNLKELHVANSGINLQTLFESIKKGCPNLQHLDISGNKMKSTDGFALAGYLESASLLTELNMNSNKCPVECLRDILVSISKDTYLRINLSSNELGLAAANIIASVPLKMTNVHTLNLSDNDFGEEGVAIIAEGLCSSTTLKGLILDRNSSKGTKKKTDIIENLNKLLQSSNSLEYLSLEGGVNKNERLRNELVPLLVNLGKNKSLTSLNLNHQSFGNNGAVALSKGLKQNHTLSNLYWDDNHTGFLGFVNMKNALKENKSLRNMPIPLLDMGLALKNESDKSKEIREILIEIEKKILANQQNQ